MKIAVVSAEFNRPVTEALEKGAVEYLKSQGLTDEQIPVVNVPGAVEVPLAVKAFLKQEDCDGVVAIGAVIRGDTSHYDYVCNSVERGCSQLQLDFMKPVGFGVITTENAEQAFARCGGDKGNKGQEAAETTLRMIRLIKEINA